MERHRSRRYQNDPPYGIVQPDSNGCSQIPEESGGQGNHRKEIYDDRQIQLLSAYRIRCAHRQTEKLFAVYRIQQDVDLATLQKEENKEEFNIGFDFLLINNESASSIPVTIEITNESKTVVARYQNLKVPYERNKETTIRGYFLTASPGISFDPDFNDDDIIIDVTPIVKNN